MRQREKGLRVGLSGYGGDQQAALTRSGWQPDTGVICPRLGRATQGQSPMASPPGKPKIQL